MTDTAFPCWADFAGKEGSDYTAAAGSDRHQLKLEYAQQLGATARPGGSFRLHFRGAAESLLPQGIYGVAGHGVDADIFLVPIERDPSGVLYEAIFL